jgi:hypothetical protein
MLGVNTRAFDLSSLSNHFFTLIDPLSLMTSFDLLACVNELQTWNLYCIQEPELDVTFISLNHL